MTANDFGKHRLDGFEPDNLLAFLALLGLLRALETARPRWRPRIGWDFDCPPLRPVLTLAEPAAARAICEAAAEGAARLLAVVDFGSARDIKMQQDEAKRLLEGARDRLVKAKEAGDRLDEPRFAADLLAALISNGTADSEGATSPSPLAYPTVAQINFLASVREFAQRDVPDPKGRTRDRSYPATAADCIHQAIFEPWRRLDRPAGLRWDGAEARRHAYRWREPTKEPPTTQHGAHRLAIVGLASMTAVPTIARGRVQLLPMGGNWLRDKFTFAWPIWRAPASLTDIQAMLAHPRLREAGALGYLSVDHVRVAERIPLGKYRNFTDGRPLWRDGATG